MSRRLKDHGPCTTYGGFRIPSDEALKREGVRLSKETMKNMKIIKTLTPKHIKIYQKDLKRLRAIGAGDWVRGFHYIMALAHKCWLQTGEIDRLSKIGGGNPRIGLIRAIEAAERQMEDDDE